jgi:hypothetical protein
MKVTPLSWVCGVCPIFYNDIYYCNSARDSLAPHSCSLLQRLERALAYVKIVELETMARYYWEVTQQENEKQCSIVSYTKG